MAREIEKEPDHAEIQTLITALKELGAAAERKFLRAILYEDGRGEIEFQAKNSWECLVIPFTDWDWFLPLLGQNGEREQLFKDAVIRKKCTKCFLHQRSVKSGDL